METNINTKQAIIFFLSLWTIFLFFFSFSITSEKKILNEKKEKNNIKVLFLEDKEKDLERKKREIENQLETISQQIKSNLRKEESIEKRIFEIEKRETDIIGKNKAEIEKRIILQKKNEFRGYLNELKLSYIREYKEKLKEETIKIICSSLERYSSSLTFSKNVQSIVIQEKSTISRIIGKDGKNIDFFRRLTGTEVLIEKNEEVANEEKNNSTLLKISCFNSLRREIAFQTLKKLIKNEQKITPIYIEKLFEKSSLEIEEVMLQSAYGVLEELGINDLDPEIVELLGKLNFRTSYGQNVLEHSLEVAKLSGTIAAEIGLDPTIAKRAGLLHDIGKSFDSDSTNSHVTNGIEIAKRFGESDIVINAIASHHKRYLADNPYSLIVSSADTLSAARPGARTKQLENYLKRMKKIESLSENFVGIKKIYSFQSGREIWVFVDSNTVSDLEAFEISRRIKKEIKQKIIIPGDVAITVIREKIFKQKIANGVINTLPINQAYKKLKDLKNEE